VPNAAIRLTFRPDGRVRQMADRGLEVNHDGESRAARPKNEPSILAAEGHAELSEFKPGPLDAFEHLRSNKGSTGAALPHCHEASLASRVERISAVVPPRLDELRIRHIRPNRKGSEDHWCKRWRAARDQGNDDVHVVSQQSLQEIRRIHVIVVDEPDPLRSSLERLRDADVASRRQCAPTRKLPRRGNFLAVQT